MKIWESKRQAEASKLFMEEWLTDLRTKLLKKCKKLLAENLIENVKTKDGDIIVLYKELGDGRLSSKVVVTTEDYTELLGLIGRGAENNIEPASLQQD